VSSLTWVCAATSVEAKACRQGIARAGRSERFEILQTGMGLKKARTALEKRLSDPRLARPDRVISSGFAGSWTRELSVGSWVLGRSIEMADGEGLFELVDDLPFRQASRLPALTSVRVVTLSKAASHGTGFTCSGKSDNLFAVDMESFAWAELCVREKIPFHIIRLISDNPDAPLPEAVGSFASIVTAASPQEKLRHLSEGLTQVVSSPETMASFILRGTRLPGLLAQGWQEIAHATL
jgi:nucleoside phosphorylase